MSDPFMKDLSDYRIHAARETLATAQLLFQNAKYKDSINRAYYSIFHGMRAILAIDGVDFKKHSGVISYFREKYIKTGILPKELSVIIGQASLVRNQSDYEDFFLASAEEAQKQLENAKYFYAVVAEYLNAL